jgi:hypothetical protein
MALFDQSKSVSPLLTVAGAVPSIGGQPCRVVIPRQSRRLQKIRVHFRFNITTTLSGATTYVLGLSGLINTVTLTVSDAAGSNRRMIDTRGTTLQVLMKRWEQTLDRYTQNNANPNLSSGSNLDIFWTIPIRYPILDDPIGYRTSMPLDENFANADPVLEITTPAQITDLGYGGGAVSITFARVTFYYDEINDAALLKAGKPLAYIPQEIKTLDLDPNANTWNLERGGWLAGVLVEEFTNTARNNRGSALASAQNDYYTLRYGRRDLRQWYTDEAVADDDNWVVSPAYGTTYSGPDLACSYIDLLAPRTQGSVFAGNSALNLYTDNAGDSAQIVATALSANGRLRLTTHKFLAPDLSALFGG